VGQGRRHAHHGAADDVGEAVVGQAHPRHTETGRQPERQILEADLHDPLAQRLDAAARLLEIAEGSLDASDPEEGIRPPDSLPGDLPESEWSQAIEKAMGSFEARPYILQPF